MAGLMRVRCIDDREFLREHSGRLVPHRGHRMISLTRGRIYRVLAVEGGWYRVVDDTDEDYLYPPNLFEVVEDS